MLEATIALQIAVGERLEVLMIAGLLILNVALGLFQENRAGAALTLLKQRLALRARVRRAAELVRTAHVESSEQKVALGVVRNLTIVNFAIIVGIVAYAPCDRDGRRPDHSPRADGAVIGRAGGLASDLYVSCHSGRQDARASGGCC
jgi:hypothetical protein